MPCSFLPFSNSSRGQWPCLHSSLMSFNPHPFLLLCRLVVEQYKDAFWNLSWREFLQTGLVITSSRQLDQMPDESANESRSSLQRVVTCSCARGLVFESRSCHNCSLMTAQTKMPSCRASKLQCLDNYEGHVQLEQLHIETLSARAKVMMRSQVFTIQFKVLVRIDLLSYTVFFTSLSSQVY